MKNVYKANTKNYFKLLDKGIKPLFPTMILSHSVKYLIVDKNREFFQYSIKKGMSITPT